jgi:hypothetical protein
VEGAVGDESDQEARRRRAARLREQINAVVGKTRTDDARRDAPRVEQVSPREFVHRRMRELDQASEDERKG